ncbi:cytochrome c oxidase subunit II [Mesorhizobium zhangyense]|nr:cytochrome c oxidase subunit II [Mesorhizobium zhangyense]
MSGFSQVVRGQAVERPPYPRSPLRYGFIPILMFAHGCAGIQSTLEPTGAEARQIATLFWVMVIGGSVVWLAVIGTLLYAARWKGEPHSAQSAGRLILWGGAIFPAVVLMALLAYALWLMPSLRPQSGEPPSAPLRIEVTGEQFWWRVSYRSKNHEASIASANEIRLPLGQRVEFVLKSSDVIHSFWIPSLGGKMDMIPGRTNRLSLLATKVGIFRGPCAEYCGTSHTLMAFYAMVMDPAAFDIWLEAQSQPSEELASDGKLRFISNGCGSCHTVHGTEATGTLGPDLTHLGSRESLAAGILPNTEEAIRRFIADPDVIKPGSKMPAFRMLPEDDLQAIASYLKGLK